MIRLLPPEVIPGSQVGVDNKRQEKRLLRLQNRQETDALNYDPWHRVSGFFYLDFGQPLPLLVTGLGVYRSRCLVGTRCLALSSQVPKGIVVVAKFWVLPLLGRFCLFADP